MANIGKEIERETVEPQPLPREEPVEAPEVPLELPELVPA